MKSENDYFHVKLSLKLLVKPLPHSNFFTDHLNHKIVNKTTSRTPSAGTQPDFFQGRGGFVELGHFHKLFFKNTRKNGPARKNFRAFSPLYS